MQRKPRAKEPVGRLSKWQHRIVCVLSDAKCSVRVKSIAIRCGVTTRPQYMCVWMALQRLATKEIILQDRPMYYTMRDIVSINED